MVCWLDYIVYQVLDSRIHDAKLAPDADMLLPGVC